MVSIFFLPVAYGLQEFGGGIGPIVQSNVRCNGTESKLADCLASGTHNCGHYQDAGAICCRAAGKNLTQEYTVPSTQSIASVSLRK